MRSPAYVNPAQLQWARNRAGLDLDVAAKAVAVKPDKLASWEQGDARPTFRQAQKLAGVFHVPFGYFFLQEPPAEQLPLPDLRTLPDSGYANPSLNLLDTVRGVLQRQAWYIEHQKDQGAAPVPFVGIFDASASVEEVAAAIREVLKVHPNQGFKNWEAYQRALVDAAEGAGVLVMRSGIVEGNTHRTLDVGEFRGFAISDPYAPVVFINSSDAPAARLFTLIHELAHLWIGSTGISSVTPGEHLKEEVFCNAVAGEFLAPRIYFMERWTAYSFEPARIVSILATELHVSRMVVWRRARDLGFIDHQTYRTEYLRQLQEFWGQDGGGGNYYSNLQLKNSFPFASAVVAEALSGRLLLRDAGRLLGIQPSKIRTFAENLSP